jgi:hypothetical protein
MENEMFHIAGGIVLAVLFLAFLPFLLRASWLLLKITAFITAMILISNYILPKPPKPYYQEDEYIKIYTANPVKGPQFYNH